MKFAAIHKDSKGYIFTPMSKTISGLLVSTEPEIRIYKEASSNKIVEAFFEVINASKQNIPAPSFNKTNIDKDKIKQKLKALDIKSFNDLNKKPTLYCSVKVDNGMIALIPSKLDVSLGKGYINKSDEIVQVNFKAQDNEILDAIEEAFNRCE
jgi:hypothetical protein